MLVLGRKEEQSIVIGGNITVKVVQAIDGYCKLGIDAPRHVPVHRKEIQDEVDHTGVDKKATALGHRNS